MSSSQVFSVQKLLILIGLSPMVHVPAGEFLTGSANSDPDAGDNEKPQHTVYLDAFWIDKTEVTNAQYNVCVQAGVCKASAFAGNSNYSGDTQPVVGVDWSDAKAYCEWAGRQLPTEAQWEKAAHGTPLSVPPAGGGEAGGARIYPWGNDPPTCELAQYYGCSPQGTVPVGSKSPADDSPYGVADMAGNVWEWVADWYDGNYYASSPARNPDGPSSGQSRVVRGGGWGGDADNLRSASRNYDGPGDRSDDIGFRCVGVPGQ